MEFRKEVLIKAQSVQLVCFDVDGVLTSGAITYSDDGRELKSFHVRDGAAIKLLLTSGIEVAILTGRTSAMVKRRAGELGIRHLHQGLSDKLPALDQLAAKLKLTTSEVAHVGDDLPDLDVFSRVGLSITVADGHPEVLARADFVTTKSGGHGVASEVAELILRAKGCWPY